MNTYIDITSKYLKVQKKRSILTVLGIILSVALLTGTCTILMSIWDKMYRDAVADNGDYYAYYSDLSSETAQKLKNHVNVKAYGAAVDRGFGIICENEVRGSKGQTPYKFFKVDAMDKAATEMLHINVVKGRLPQSPNEIAVDEWTLRYLPGAPGIGQSIKLDLGARKTKDGKGTLREYELAENEVFEKSETKVFTIVGLTKQKFVLSSNFARAVTYVDNSKLDPSFKYRVYIKTETQRDIRKNISSMAKDLKISAQSIKFNEGVLRYLAQSGNDNINSTLISFGTFFMIIIMIATVAVIYNAFNISVLERISQFGLLRCVGATPSQIRRLVLREALILSAIGIPIGLFLGTLAMKIIFWTFSIVASELPFADLKVIISPYIIVLSILLELVTVFISAIGPARKASKVSPIEAVRNTGNLRKEKLRRISKARVAGMVLGAEGWIAWKNLGRNRKRVWITVFSMVISIILFIVSSSFLDLAIKSGAAGEEDIPDFSIYSRDGGDVRISDDEYRAIKDFDGLEFFYKVSSTNAYALIHESKLNSSYKDYIKSISGKQDGKIKLYNNEFKTYGDEALNVLKKYLKQGHIDIGQLNGENGVIIVKTTSQYIKDDKKTAVFDVAGINPGDEIEIGLKSDSNETKKVKVMAVLSQNVLQSKYNENCGFSIITTEKIYSLLTGSAENPKNISIQMKQGVDTSKVKKYLEELTEKYEGLEVIDYGDRAKNGRATYFVLGILLYGFIAIISLIGCINIFNTISTNIILRTRELAIIKAVGMTGGGIKRLVYLESIYFCIFAAIIGGTVGSILSKAMFSLLDRVKEFEWSIPWNSIAISVLGMVMVSLFSASLPLRRINNGVIVENIRVEQ
ncbi:MAG: FtsX-like permease family protein [Clostridia bacterium]|nr:FtsX-like permease family protein [Clostridia bacterium]